MKPTLTYLQTCTEDQHDWRLNEFSQNFKWLEHPLEPGDLVDMGGPEKRFRVVQVERYEPINLNQPLSAINFAQVCLDDQPMPPRETWESSLATGEIPYGVVEAVGEPIEDMGMYMASRIGKPFELSFFEPSQYDCYKPIASNASYPAIYLAWQKVAVAA